MQCSIDYRVAQYKEHDMMTQPIQMFENLTSETSPAGGNGISKTNRTFDERRLLEAEVIGKAVECVRGNRP